MRHLPEVAHTIFLARISVKGPSLPAEVLRTSTPTALSFSMMICYSSHEFKMRCHTISISNTTTNPTTHLNCCIAQHFASKVPEHRWHSDGNVLSWSFSVRGSLHVMSHGDTLRRKSGYTRLDWKKVRWICIAKYYNSNHITMMLYFVALTCIVPDGVIENGFDTFCIERWMLEKVQVQSNSMY